LSEFFSRALIAVAYILITHARPPASVVVEVANEGR